MNTPTKARDSARTQVERTELPENSIMRAVAKPVTYKATRVTEDFVPDAYLVWNNLGAGCPEKAFDTMEEAESFIRSRPATFSIEWGVKDSDKDGDAYHVVNVGDYVLRAEGARTLVVSEAELHRSYEVY